MEFQERRKCVQTDVDFLNFLDFYNAASAKIKREPKLRGCLLS